MDKISILEVIGDPSLAGAPRHLLGILEKIDYKKFSVAVICPAGPLAGEIRKNHKNVELELVPMKSRFDWQSVRKIRKEIKHLKSDIIHVHGTRAGMLGRLAAIGFNKPLVYTEHLWTKQFKLSNPLLNLFHFWAYWALDLFTTLNIAVSNAVKDFMIEAQISHKDKIKVIYNGIDFQEKSAEPFESEREFLLATVGTLNEHKGVQYLIKALPKVIKEFPGIYLEVIGDGAYRKELESLVKRLKLKNYVKFTGFMPDVEKYLLKFDLYLQPSLSESFGLAIVQAMGVGLPVIATKTGGIPEVVNEGVSGILVEPADHRELSEAILQVLRDPKRSKEMGHKAQKEVKEKFQLKDMVEKLEEVYTNLAKNKK